MSLTKIGQGSDVSMQLILKLPDLSIIDLDTLDAIAVYIYDASSKEIVKYSDKELTNYLLLTRNTPSTDGKVTINIGRDVTKVMSGGIAKAEIKGQSTNSDFKDNEFQSMGFVDIFEIQEAKSKNQIRTY